MQILSPEIRVCCSFLPWLRRCNDGGCSDVVAAAKLAVVAGAAAMAKRGELRERWRSKLGRGGVAKKLTEKIT